MLIAAGILVLGIVAGWLLKGWWDAPPPCERCAEQGCDLFRMDCACYVRGYAHGCKDTLGD